MCRIIAYYKERQKVVSELRFAIVKVQKNRDYILYGISLHNVLFR